MNETETDGGVEIRKRKENRSEREERRSARTVHIF